MKIGRLTLTVNNNTVNLEDIDLTIEELKLLMEMLNIVVTRDC